MARAASQYLVWILPRWRDPLFLWRGVGFAVALGVMLLLSLGFAQPMLGWLILFVSVWPYRSVLTVHDSCIRIRWLVFISTISRNEIVEINLEPAALNSYLLTLYRRGAPQLVLQGSRPQLAALRAVLLRNLDFAHRSSDSETSPPPHISPPTT